MTDYAENPRADVNQDGVVNAADLLAIRSPENWQKKVRPDGVPELTVIRYDGTDPDGCAVDVRTNSNIFSRRAIISSAHGVVASAYWNISSLLLDGCDIQTEGYGVYSEINLLALHGTTIAARRRDPLRIAGGTDIRVIDCTFAMPLSDVSVRVHGNASKLTFRRCTFHCWSWGLDIGEQYRGAGGCVRDVLLEDCTFIASSHTIHGVRIRGQGVRLVRCKGIGFDKAQSGATFATVEKHSCDPTGAVLEGCAVDGNRPLLKGKWTDTEVR